MRNGQGDAAAVVDDGLHVRPDDDVKEALGPSGEEGTGDNQGRGVRGSDGVGGRGEACKSLRNDLKNCQRHKNDLSV